MNKYDIAWNNSPEIPGKDPKTYRKCPVCGEELERNTYCHNGLNKMGWDVEHLDGDQKNDDPTNIRAVHHKCNETKPKLAFCDAIHNAKQEKKVEEKK